MPLRLTINTIIDRRKIGFGPSAPIKGWVLVNDLKLWALFESGKLSYNNAQAAGLAVSLEL